MKLYQEILAQEFANSLPVELQGDLQKIVDFMKIIVICLLLCYNDSSLVQGRKICR